jgi:hypothetical protein
VALFGRGPEIELLVIILAAACAVVALVVDGWLRGRST